MINQITRIFLWGETISKAELIEISTAHDFSAHWKMFFEHRNNVGEMNWDFGKRKKDKIWYTYKKRGKWNNNDVDDYKLSHANSIKFIFIIVISSLYITVLYIALMAIVVSLSMSNIKCFCCIYMCVCVCLYVLPKNCVLKISHFKCNK